MAGKSISYFEQKRDLVEIKTDIRPEYKDLASHVLQDVVLRVEKAYKAFFRRVKNGEKSGFPRFKGKNWYDSFCYPDGAGWKLNIGEGGKARLHLSKIGDVRVKMHRPIEGKIKTATIKREGEHWYVTFACEVEAEALPASYEGVGIDLGMTHFAACSDGSMIDNPRHYRQAEKKLKRLQEALSRKKRGSHRRKKAVRLVARAHRKVRNQRKDFHHKESRKLVHRYQVIVFEN
jgi:putative transposase